MLDPWLAAVGALAVAIAVTARRLEHLPVSEPLLALLLGVALGPVGLGLMSVPAGLEQDLIRLAARLTLAVSLMAVALRFPLNAVLRRQGSIAVLLLIVLPGMVLTAGASATLGLGLGFGTALAIGAALAPTDPILASTSVSGEASRQAIPERLRLDLSVESGANDGLALPFVVVTAAIATGTGVGGATLTAVWSVVGAAVIGMLVGWATADLLRRAERQGDVDPSHEVTYSLVLSIGTLGLVDLVGADGLLGVFVAGLVLNGRLPSEERGTEQTIDEGINQVLILPVFALFGAVLPWTAWSELGWQGLAFAVAVLLVRRLPVVLAVRPLLGARLADVVWLGWFGPVGAAALYYLVHLRDLGVDETVIWPAGTLVVALSTVLHGVTSTPGRVWYARIPGAREPSAS